MMGSHGQAMGRPCKYLRGTTRVLQLLHSYNPGASSSATRTHADSSSSCLEYALVLTFAPLLLQTVVMLMFREEKSPEDEIKAWQFWHGRQHSVKQRILDAGKEMNTSARPKSYATGR